jgi:hypothetical protein
MSFAELQGITTKVDVIEGPPVSDAQEKKAVAAVSKACKEVIQKGKGLEWKKPSGKQEGFLIDVDLWLELRKKGNKHELQGEVTITVLAVPSKKKILKESLGKKTSLADTKKIEKDLEALAHEITRTLLQKKVVKVLEKQAAEHSDSKT